MCLSVWLLIGKAVICISGCYVSLSRDPERATSLVFLFIVTYGDHWTSRTAAIQCFVPKRCAKTWGGSSYSSFLVCRTGLLGWFLWNCWNHTEIVYVVSLLVCYYSITLHYLVGSLGNVLMKLNISLKILQLVGLKLNVHPIPCGRVSFW